MKGSVESALVARGTTLAFTCARFSNASKDCRNFILNC